MSKRVLVGMSGGVDSAATAYLLHQQGYEVAGATFVLWSGEETEESKCCSVDDVEDARYVCSQLGVPHYVFNYKDLFRRTVVEPFVEGYRQGRTPNPCILCNRHIKFDAFSRRARELGFDYIATGHYARVTRDPESGRYQLRRALHPEKDQSYVLYHLTQEQLSMFLLPLGDYSKEEVRQIARDSGLVVAKKPDSQDICFVPDGDHAAFISRYTGEAPKQGYFVDQQGNRLGPHKGIARYTVGQRKGLGISLGKTMYVSRISSADQTVTLVEDESLLFRDSLRAEDVSYLSIPPLTAPRGAEIRIRYSQGTAKGEIIPQEDGSVLVQFERPQRAPTPGQAVVFYDGDLVLGGGTISGD